jgi:hypothetical protein
MTFNRFAPKTLPAAPDQTLFGMASQRKHLTQPATGLWLPGKSRPMFRSSLLAFAFAVAAAAQSPQLTVTAAAGPGTNLSSIVSLPITATVSSTVTLSYIVDDSRASALASYCMPGSGSCQGSLSDSVSVGANSILHSGSYTVTAAVAANIADSGTCGAKSSCSFTLPAGNYTLQANLSDNFVGLSGGVADPFSEAFTAVLTVNTGNVVAATEPVPFPDPSTCPIKAGIKSFILEDQLFATSFQTSFIPTLSAAAFAAFTNPNVEVHTHFTFDTTSMIFRADSVVLPLGAPPITPSGYDFADNAIATVIVQAEKVYALCSPRPTIMVVGPITGGTPVFGSLLGVPHSFSFSFDPTITSNINNASNVTITDAGANAVVSLLASVVVTPATLTATITGAPTINTMYKEIVLDGTPSVSSGGNMTYQWSAASGVDVGILDPVSPQTRIKIGGPKGNYPVTLTVATPFGTASSTVTVHYDPKL